MISRNDGLATGIHDIANCNTPSIRDIPYCSFTLLCERRRKLGVWLVKNLDIGVPCEVRVHRPDLASGDVP